MGPDKEDLMRKRWLTAVATALLTIAVALAYLSGPPGSASAAEAAREPLGMRREFSFLPMTMQEQSEGEGHDSQQLTSFVWKEPSLTSSPNPQQAAYIIEKGRAELLAPFLAERTRTLLERELGGIDEAIRSTAEVYDAVVSEAKADPAPKSGPVGLRVRRLGL